MSAGAAKTEIDLIVGFSPTTPPLKIVRDAGFGHRTGVIQHTYRSNCVDAYFDESLWRRLVEFAKTFGVVSVIDRPWGGPRAPNRDWHSGKADQPSAADERPMEGFLERWNGDYPPEMILARNGGRVDLSIATEYWAQVGGPRPYADSFTYSICSRDDLSERLAGFLRSSSDAIGWSLSLSFLNANESFA